MTGSDTVEHLVFGNNQGITVIAGSIVDPAQRNRWERVLDGFVRLEPFQGTPPPAWGLSYVELDAGRAAVIYRFDDGTGSLGRNRAHALIGSSELLTPTVAMGLYRWSRWPMPVQAGAPLHPVPYHVIKQESDRVGKDLAREAKRCDAQLTQVLATISDRPDDRLMILGCPAEDAVPLLWGLHHIADRVFARGGRAQDWTFSTYESSSLDVEGAPRIVFLPGRPDGATSRAAVNLRRIGAAVPVSTESTAWAQRVVDKFVKGLGAPASDTPLTVESDSEVTRELAYGAPPPGDAGTRAAGGVTYAERGSDYMTASASQTHEGSAGRTSGPPSDRPDLAKRVGGLPGDYYGSSPGDGRNAQHGPPPAERSPLVARLLETRDAAGFAATIDQWSRETPVLPYLPPAELFEVFEHVAARSPGQQDSIVQALLSATLGPECKDVDTPDGLDYVQEVLRISAGEAPGARRAKPLVWRMVVHSRKQLGSMSRLNSAIADPYLRWLDVRPEPARGPAAAHRTVAHEDRPVSWRSAIESALGLGKGGRDDTGHAVRPAVGNAPSGRGNGWLIGGVLALLLAIGLVVVFSRLPTSVSTTGSDDAPAATTQPTLPVVDPTSDQSDAEEPVGSGLPSYVTAQAGDVPDGSIAYILYRGGDTAYVGPQCFLVDGEYRCVPEGLPEDVTTPLVQVVVSTEEVRADFADQPIEVGPRGESLPDGMTVIADEEFR